MAKTDFKSVDQYIGTFPKAVQAGLQTIRRTIQNAVPEAQEAISYQIPAFRFHGRLLYFAAFKDHYSVFGASQEARKAFKKELSKYEEAKGTIRLPMSEPLPVGLLRDLARYGAEENLVRERTKK
ncbi:MAG TPA: DUF1801 domain-containing protein [Thermoplasmata archaeon]|jgi:uncharacterized protein YdhG (YjbR/CyaY superfamily)|nr:DUF1801 domain-containing protein [Thermoplasmata archaeon]